MKIKVLMALMLLTGLCQASTTKLTDFEQAAGALTAGHLLTFVVQFPRCEIKNTNNINLSLSQLQATYRPEGILLDAKEGMIAARGITYSDTIRSLPELVSVNQAYTYVYTKNGELHITNRFLDPATFKPQLHPIEFTCTQGKGFEVYLTD